MDDYRAPRFLPLGTLRSEGNRPARLAAELGAEARAVVLRPVPDALARSPEALEALRVEARRHAEAPIPHLLRVIEVVDLDDGRCLVEEHVDGVSLAELRDSARARERAVPPLVMARLLADACAGIEAAAPLPGITRERPAETPVLAAAIRIGFDGVTRFAPCAAGWPAVSLDDLVPTLAGLLRDELAVAIALNAGVAPEALRRLADRAASGAEPDVAGFRAALLRCLAGGALVGPGYVKHILVDLVPLDSPPRAAARLLRVTLSTLASTAEPNDERGPAPVPARGTESILEHGVETAAERDTVSADRARAEVVPRTAPTPESDAVAPGPGSSPIIVLRWPPRSRRAMTTIPAPLQAGCGVDSMSAAPSANVAAEVLEDPVLPAVAESSGPFGVVPALSTKDGSDDLAGHLATDALEPATTAFANSPALPTRVTNGNGIGSTVVGPGETAPTALPASGMVAGVTAPRTRRGAWPLVAAALGGAFLTLAVVHFSERPSTAPMSISTAAASEHGEPASAASITGASDSAATPAGSPSDVPTGALAPRPSSDPRPAPAEPSRKAAPAARPVARNAPKRAAPTRAPVSSPASSATTATVEIRAPAGSAVEIDGVHRGVAPFAVPLPLTEGAHSIRVTRGEGVYDTRLYARAGEDYTLDVFFVGER